MVMRIDNVGNVSISMVMPIGPRLLGRSLVVVQGLYLWQMFKTDSQTHRNRANPPKPSKIERLFSSNVLQ